jgi:hypothetical protein
VGRRANLDAMVKTKESLPFSHQKSNLSHPACKETLPLCLVSFNCNMPALHVLKLSDVMCRYMSASVSVSYHQ